MKKILILLTLLLSTQLTTAQETVQDNKKAPLLVENKAPKNNDNVIAAILFAVNMTALYIAYKSC